MWKASLCGRTSGREYPQRAMRLRHPKIRKSREVNMIARILASAALAAGLAASAAPGAANAQFVQKPTVTSEAAKQMALACEAFAAKNGWKMVVAVLDSTGNLLHFHRMQDAPLRSIDYAQRKAMAALRQDAPSKTLADRMAKGENVLLATGMLPLQGGLPIRSGGVLAGAIGASGATAAQDEQCVQVGIDAVVGAGR